MIYRAPKKISEKECEKISNEFDIILEEGNDIIIDLKETEYISSAGIRVFIMNLKNFRAKGYDFSIVNPNQNIIEIFKITGLLNILLYQEKDIKELKKTK